MACLRLVHAQALHVVWTGWWTSATRPQLVVSPRCRIQDRERREKTAGWGRRGSRGSLARGCWLWRWASGESVWR
ncbi:hypothetical protein CGRA01v4_06343 [Colletotrichum graminicola]|nr:hypothetical protein CGRA01v4_06343 [Colletotrichum graminicola]